MIEGISAVTLGTHDMPRAVRFYRALGFEVLYGGEHSSFTSFRAGTSYLNLIIQPAEQRWSWWGRVIFYVADVDALYDLILLTPLDQYKHSPSCLRAGAVCFGRTGPPNASAGPKPAEALTTKKARHLRRAQSLKSPVCTVKSQASQFALLLVFELTHSEEKRGTEASRQARSNPGVVRLA
jgi:hypothetical protein